MKVLPHNNQLIVKPVNLGAALKFFLLVFLGGDRVGDLLGDALVPMLVLRVDMILPSLSKVLSVLKTTCSSSGVSSWSTMR